MPRFDKSPIYQVKVYHSETSLGEMMNVVGHKRARDIMDAYLAVGWYGLDWYDQSGKLIVKVRPGCDPLDPRILTILEASNDNQQPA